MKSFCSLDNKKSYQLYGSGEKVECIKEVFLILVRNWGTLRKISVFQSESSQYFKNYLLLFLQEISRLSIEMSVFLKKREKSLLYLLIIWNLQTWLNGTRRKQLSIGINKFVQAFILPLKAILILVVKLSLASLMSMKSLSLKSSCSLDNKKSYQLYGSAENGSVLCIGGELGNTENPLLVLGGIQAVFFKTYKWNPWLTIWFVFDCKTSHLLIFTFNFTSLGIFWTRITSICLIVVLDLDLRP